MYLLKEISIRMLMPHKKWNSLKVMYIIQMLVLLIKVTQVEKNSFILSNVISIKSKRRIIMGKDNINYLIKDITQENNSDISVNQKNVIIIYCDSSSSGIASLNSLEEILGEDFNLEVDEKGEVRLNEERMEVKEFKDGSKALFLGTEEIKTGKD